MQTSSGRSSQPLPQLWEFYALWNVPCQHISYIYKQVLPRCDQNAHKPAHLSSYVNCKYFIKPKIWPLYMALVLPSFKVYGNCLPSFFVYKLSPVPKLRDSSSHADHFVLVFCELWPQPFSGLLKDTECVVIQLCSCSIAEMPSVSQSVWRSVA